MNQGRSRYTDGHDGLVIAVIVALSDRYWGAWFGLQSDDEHIVALPDRYWGAWFELQSDDEHIYVDAASKSSHSDTSAPSSFSRGYTFSLKTRNTFSLHRQHALDYSLPLAWCEHGLTPDPSLLSSIGRTMADVSVRDADADELIKNSWSARDADANADADELVKNSWSARDTDADELVKNSWSARDADPNADADELVKNS
ncbi:hypothetical protein BDV95DRAFT_591865 [Massariosphaeria phaeospora]|uniref:Uncharacterized protein n=1 Tax=Massariosphaeria phaeospora TaxID=100035 RepID=A0A7C8IB11_9PLEO|nr:hypothetical protein BDV95DRAFT_591865 [Massariosphaeria phaeospora]